MEITYMVIVTLVTLIAGAITKTFVDVVPNKFIPLQNLIIGLVATAICFFGGIETDFLQALCLCVFASMGAGGIADLKKVKE